MNRADLPFQTVAALSELIRRGEISPVEATEAYLERIDALNGDLRAYLTITPDLARQGRPRRRGRNRPRPVPRPPARHSRSRQGSDVHRRRPHHRRLAGVQRFHAGLRRHRGGPPEAGRGGAAGQAEYDRIRHHRAVASVRAAAQPLAPRPLQRRLQQRPADSGAATAAFMCAAALGEDTGGSVRFPAAWCGLAGLRPTWGLVSRYGVMPGVRSMDTVGPLSRTVEDCALMLQAIAGPDPQDRLTRQQPPPDYRAALTGDVRGLRCGILREVLDAPSVDAATRQSVLDAANVLAGLGAEVQEVSAPLAAHAGAINGGIRLEAPTTYRELLRQRPQAIAHDNRIGYLTNAIMPAAHYYKAIQLRTLLRAQILQTLESVDLLLSPTAGVPAQPLSPDPIITGKHNVNRTPWLLTAVPSLANLPALAVPCGFSADGLPLSLQIAGRPYADPTVLRAGHAYEQATEWHTRRPPV